MREGSFNYNLARFLGNPVDTAVPRTFVFEDLNFQTGSARLTPESTRTVTDLVAILKAYPTAKAHLDGHTDNTGDAAANKQLSLDRVVDPGKPPVSTLGFGKGFGAADLGGPQA